MPAKYNSNSNYSKTVLNKKYLETYNPLLTRNSLSPETILVKVEGKYNRRPDLMAYDYFGSSDLWWVIVHYNREVLKDPINDFTSGLELVIPKSFRNPGGR